LTRFLQVKKKQAAAQSVAVPLHSNNSCSRSDYSTERSAFVTKQRILLLLL